MRCHSLGVSACAPATNRVTPYGDVESFALRGAWTGNRGRLHCGREIVRFHATHLWIICALHFKDRWNEQWLPRRFTWLYFHDEAVAFAAGHRPCGECRYRSYTQYRDAWADAAGGAPPSARDMNRQLHAERVVRGTHRRRRYPVPWRNLPDGAFADVDGRPFLVLGAQIVEWTRHGYAARAPRPTRGDASVLTPPATLNVLRAGYPVQIDDHAVT